MKTTRNILSALIAAGLPGVALLALTDRLPSDLVLGGLTAVALFAFAIYDFSRNTASLKAPGAAILRPPFHVADRGTPVTVRKAA
jgi:hypothetical protein